MLTIKSNWWDKRGYKMTKAINLFYALLFSLAVTFAAISVSVMPSASAQEEQQPEQISEQSEENQTESGSYFFTAQPGDSYSKIARKAVQIYGIDNNVNLSGEQIVFAETNLTIEAGSPVLNEGQDVSISKESVKNWVDKANELTDAQKSAWSVYTVNVDFNTNNVGE